MTEFPFHLMIKPAGPDCNLSCEYCYYLEKSRYYDQDVHRMDDETLERVTAAYLKNHPGGEVVFAWQGGEPLLMGIEFFRRALDLQTKYSRPDQQVVNTLQTNAMLIDEDWAAFFAENGFLIGVSLDGPADLHDRYRRDRGGRPSHSRVLKGLEHLQRHNVEHNALVTVNRVNVEHPLRVYNHLVDLGVRYLQYIPIVECQSRDSHEVTVQTVRPEPFGDFLCKTFDHWVANDVGRVFVQLFESTLNVWLGGFPSVCVYAPMCGRALVVEHNGDLYACDHFVYPEYRRGVVNVDDLASLVDGPEQQSFGEAKAALSLECRRCQVLPFCGGDCPKHRIRRADGDYTISYLCSGYRRFFTHSAPVLRDIAAAIAQDLSTRLA